MGVAMRFNDDHNAMIFGRNYDNTQFKGADIIVAPHQYAATFAFNAQDLGNAVIGVGSIEQDTPLYHDCANEHGLAVAAIHFDQAQYAHDTT